VVVLRRTSRCRRLVVVAAVATAGDTVRLTLRLSGYQW
jgi:hypothetical protein